MIIAGTGHRPKFCPCKYNEKHIWLLELKNHLKTELEDYDPKAVISGMAIGWDTWLAQVALEIGIPVWAYVPFKGQGQAWPSSSKKEYQRILDESEKVLYVSEEYHKGAFHQRDRAMVDDADVMFSLLHPDAKSGGTHYTVEYAKKRGLEVINFWDDYDE